MSYSISRPLSSKYARQLLRKWNQDVHKPMEIDGHSFRHWQSLQIGFPSDFLWLTMDLTGRSAQMISPKNENVHLAILSLVCREMLKTDHTNAKVLLTMVDDACSVWYKYLAVDTARNELKSPVIPIIPIFGESHERSISIEPVATLQDWNVTLSCAMTIKMAFYTLLRVWVSAFQSFIEMTDYRYEVWGYRFFNEFSADYVL